MRSNREEWRRKISNHLISNDKRDAIRSAVVFLQTVLRKPSEPHAASVPWRSPQADVRRLRRP